jgi:hypothetical protein
MKMDMTRGVLLLMILLLGLGCSGSPEPIGQIGHPFDTTHVHDIQPGMDKSQIRQWFGEPYSISDSQEELSNGAIVDTVWEYRHTIGSSQGRTRIESLVVFFDGNGKVLGSGFSED